MGFDISPSMLDIAVARGVGAGDVAEADMGQGLPFRDGAFDGAVSISAVQWLCNADARSHDPRRRIHVFFSSLYRVLARGARAVLQIYPDGASQAQMLTTAAMRAGFTGGLVVDFPHSTRAKKYFLVLMVGSSGYVPQAKGLDGGEGSEGEIDVEGRQKGARRGKRDLGPRKGKQWVHKKKAQRRMRGDQTASDSKFTARKRKPKF